MMCIVSGIMSGMIDEHIYVVLSTCRIIKPVL